MSRYTFVQVEFMSPEYDDCIRLRNEILRIPLNLEYDCNQLEAEFDQFHFGLYDADFSLLGCLVFERLSKEVIKMRQVAIDVNYQRKGLGKILVRASESWAIDHNYKLIELHARDVAVPFYSSLGYFCEGQPFIEVNIKHHKMIKKLYSCHEKN